MSGPNYPTIRRRTRLDAQFDRIRAREEAGLAKSGGGSRAVKKFLKTGRLANMATLQCWVWFAQPQGKRIEQMQPAPAATALWGIEMRISIASPE